MKFRKKPVVIDAQQITGDDIEAVAEWCSGDIVGMATSCPEISIHTLEGSMRGQIGDWIIRGVNGEFYPCKPDIFEKTYEKVDQ